MNVVFTPEYLGGQQVDVDRMEHPYELGLFLHLTKGQLSEAQSDKIAPRNKAESMLAENVVGLCVESIDTAMEKIDDDEDDHHVLGLKASRAALTTGNLPRGVFLNSYEEYNQYTHYHTDVATLNRKVVKLPTGVRSFTVRSSGLLKSIDSYRYSRGTNEPRFQSTEELKHAFPCLDIDSKLTDFDRSVLDAIYGNSELPVVSTAKQASEIISLLGGGTIFNALERRKDELTEVEQKIKSLGFEVMRHIGGRTVLKQTAIGRSVWGAHSIRLRSGDTIPKVTLPKPGV